jgi:hypothetical protein
MDSRSDCVIPAFRLHVTIYLINFVSVICIIVITQCRATVAMNCRVITRCMNVSCVSGHERASRRLYEILCKELWSPCLVLNGRYIILMKIWKFCFTDTANCAVQLNFTIYDNLNTSFTVAIVILLLSLQLLAAYIRSSKYLWFETHKLCRLQWRGKACVVSSKDKCPYLDAVWARVHSCEITVQKNVAPTQKAEAPFSSKKRPHFQTRKWNEQKFGHDARWDLKTRVIALQCFLVTWFFKEE